MVTSVYHLKLNYDGSQHMGHPEGNLPDSPNVPPPAVQGLSAAATGPYNIALDWTPVAGATYYNVQRAPDNVFWSDIGGVAAPPYDSGGLNADTEYYYRIFSSNSYGWSALPSNTAFETTEAVVPVDGFIFGDDFEGQPLGVAAGSGLNPPAGDPNARWSGTSASGGSTCTVENGPSSKALHCVFKSSTSYAWCEPNITLGSVYHNFTLEFDLYIPDGTESYGGVAYKHRPEASGGAATNRKFFRLYNDYYNNNPHKIGASLWRVDDDTSQLALDIAYPSGSIGPKGGYATVISASDRGSWINFRFEITACTATNPTTIKVFRNNVEILDVTDDQYSGAATGYTRGYLMGWFNSGFDADTTLVLDNFGITA